MMINKLFETLAELKTIKSSSEKRLKDAQETIDEITAKAILSKRTQEFLSTLSVESKKAVKESIERMVSSGLCYIYGEGHSFELDITHRRNQNEIDFFINDGNQRIQLVKPFAGKGGGKISVAAMLLQIAVLEFVNVSGALFLDEATKYADTEAVKKTAEFLKKYSTKRQVINITHHSSMNEVADTKVVVSKNPKGVAEVYIEA